MGSNIFLQRLRKELSFQWNIFRSVIDWTIFIYLFVPALAIIGYNYYLLWVSQPDWVVAIPLPVYLSVLYFFCWQGYIRTFLEEADQLFLIQKNKALIELKKRTRDFYLYGYILGILSILIIMLPFLYNHFSLTWIQISLIGFYLCSLRTAILITKQYLDDIQSTWKKWLYSSLLFILLGLFTLSIIQWSLYSFEYLLIFVGLIQLVISFFYSSLRMKKKTTFLQDVKNDKIQKLKLMKMIFIFSEYVEKVPEQRKRNPLFYRNSKRIYNIRNRRKALQELYIKVFIRNKGYLLQYLQITGVTVTAILVIPPVWIKCLLLLGYSLLIQSWLKVVYKRVMANHFIVTVRKDDPVRFQAERFVVNAFSLPVICIVGIITLSVILL
ncbi:ABC transporter permease [Fredinandcohnia sp. 179-A 10B2 NHS]|uniref:ABC transporter permease n=1 Tax=Fredinandcohnia sp. 179-A 10B2 NHS TaxID=3235176 RepID=UPI0039A3A205